MKENRKIQKEYEKLTKKEKDKTEKLRLENMAKVYEEAADNLQNISETTRANIDNLKINPLFSNYSSLETFLKHFTPDTIDLCGYLTKISFYDHDAVFIRNPNYLIDNNKKEITDSLKTSFRFVFMIGFPMMLGICAIAPDLIPKFLGEGFEQSVSITYAISPIILFIGLSNIIGMQYLLPTMRQRQYTISVALGAAVNLICNLLLIPTYKAVGAAVATVAAEAVVTGVQILFVRKEIQIRKLLPMAIKYVVFSAIMFAVVVFSNKTFLLNCPEVARVFIDVFIGIVVYFAILVITKDKFIFKTAKKMLERDE